MEEMSVLDRLAVGGVAERLIATAEREDAAEREKRRAAAFKALAVLDKQEAAKFAAIDKRLAEARKLAAAARAEYAVAEAAAGKIRQERSVAGARLSVRRERLLATIRAGTPPAIAEFIRECAVELQRLRGAEPGLDFEESFHFWGPYQGFFEKTSFGTGPALVARTEALADAIARARAIVEQDLPPDELGARVVALREAIPRIGWQKLGGPPLPESSAPRGAFGRGGRQ